MFLRSLLTHTPLMVFNMDGEGAPGAPVDSAPAPAESAPAAPVDTGPDSKPEPVALSVDEQLDKVWDTAHTPRNERGQFAKRNADDGDDGDDIEFPDDDPGLNPDEGETDDGGKENDPPQDEGKVGPEQATDDMPQSWSKDKAEVWKSLTPEAKAYVTQRETDTTKALSNAGRAVGALKAATPILEAVSPHAEYLGEVGRRLGVEPGKLVGDVLRFERTLRTAPSNDVKLTVLKDIVAEYGIDVSPLIGADAASALKNATQADITSHPAFKALENKLNTIEQSTVGVKQAEAAEASRQMDDAISSAQADTTNFPHFNTVSALMGSILQAMDDASADMSYGDLIKTAYERACRAHPEISKRLEADTRRKFEEEQARKRREKATRSQSAAAPNVKSGIPSPQKRTADQELAAIADKAYGRD